MSLIPDLITRLHACPDGPGGWQEFEDLGIEILSFLFVPPLAEPKVQPRTYSGIRRRDAVFPVRNPEPLSSWSLLQAELDVRLLLVEFKNYDATEIGQDEVDQVNNYMTKPMGRLALMVCNKDPNGQSHVRRNTLFANSGRVILFLTKDHLEEMLYTKPKLPPWN